MSKIKTYKNQSGIHHSDILLSSVIESLSEGIIVTDNEGRFILHNSKFLELWRISPSMIASKNEKEIIRYAFKQIETPGKFYRRLRIIRNGENKDFGLINLTDGRMIEYFITPLIIAEKKGYLGIFSDITEKTRMFIKFEEYMTNLEKIVKLRTEQISNLNKQLTDEVEKSKIAERVIKASLEKEKDLSQLKSSFISTASHEFKTPVTTILSSIDLMEAFWENQNLSKFKEHKDKIKSKVHSLIKLIDDVLIVHQIEKNIVVIKNETLNLKEVIDDLVEEIKIIDKQNHNIIFNYNCDIKNIESDPKIYRHVVSNLLMNSVKYTPINGNIVLEVNLTSDSVKIIVSDEGPGISPENITTIFEPFERGKYHGDKEGSGLGLSIVKYTLDLCGGDIEVVSQKNKGTKIFVTIPYGQK